MNELESRPVANLKAPVDEMGAFFFFKQFKKSIMFADLFDSKDINNLIVVLERDIHETNLLYQNLSEEKKKESCLQLKISCVKDYIRRLKIIKETIQK